MINATHQKTIGVADSIFHYKTAHYKNVVVRVMVALDSMSS